MPVVEQRTSGGYHLRPLRARVDRHAFQQPDGRRSRNRIQAMRRSNGAAADIQRRRDDAIGTEQLERMHRADNVDDGIERADLVQMDFVDRRAVNGPFDLAEPRKERLRPILAGRAQTRPINQGVDLR